MTEILITLVLALYIIGNSNHLAMEKQPGTNKLGRVSLLLRLLLVILLSVVSPSVPRSLPDLCAGLLGFTFASCYPGVILRPMCFHSNSIL